MTKNTDLNDELQGEAFVPPRSPLRVMNILEELAAVPGGLPLVRLCERLELPKTSLLSYLRSLENAKYVQNNHGVYQLGESALRLSSMIAASVPFPHSVHNRLTALVAKTNETALLGMLSEDGTAAVYVDKVECQRTIRFAAFIGMRRPLYASGIGKALLAFQAPDFIADYLSKADLMQHTARTITDRTSLERELLKIQRSGVSTGLGELDEGVGVISSPIFGGLGNVAAAVSVAGPLDRIKALQKDLSAAVIDCAREMSQLLGWKHD